MSLWLIRAGEKGRLINDFINKEIVGLGFNKLGDLSQTGGNDIVREQLKEHYPDKNRQTITKWVKEIEMFLNIDEGDYVVTFDTKNRIYHIGKIIGKFEYNQKICEYHNIRKVEWLSKISRDNLTVSTQAQLCRRLTVFKTDKPERDEIFLLLEGKKISNEKIGESKEELELIREDIVEQSSEFIKDKLMKLDWNEMQELIAGILRAMGYKTIVSNAGPDRGKDIIASTDGLGLEEPRISVEVKHRKGSIGAPGIRSFIGGLRKGNKGLYVSTGGFTKEAKYEAERSTIPITLIDSNMIVNLIVKHYEDFDIETRTLVPLKKLYWPV